jgi:glycerophosphoryl diester phosphodiesterase
MVIIIAHRGASYIEPENTLRSFRKALDMGADAIEFDVRFSKDNIPIIIHDDTVDRTTNGKGKVNNMLFSELRKLDAGMGEQIPTLQEALNLIDRKALILIELKERYHEDIILKEVLLRNLLDNVIFISFHYDVLNRLRNLNNNVKTGYLYYKPPAPINEASQNNAFAILPRYNMISSRIITWAHSKGLKVYAWTVDDPNKAMELVKEGVDGIATNKPDIIKNVVKNFKHA